LNGLVITQKASGDEESHSVNSLVESVCFSDAKEDHLLTYYDMPTIVGVSP